jgi:hypothetical protein
MRDANLVKKQLILGLVFMIGIVPVFYYGFLRQLALYRDKQAALARYEVRNCPDDR